MKHKHANLRVESLRNAAGAAAVAGLVLYPEQAFAANVTLSAAIHAGGANWYVTNDTSVTDTAGLGIYSASLTGTPVLSSAYTRSHSQ